MLIADGPKEKKPTLRLAYDFFCKKILNLLLDTGFLTLKIS